MNQLTRFYKNFRYFLKILRTVDCWKNPLWETDYTDLLTHPLYYIPQAQLRRPKIYSPHETIRVLQQTSLSLARFGDGELNLINGHSIPYQEYTPQLGARLREILSTSHKNLLVGINYWYFFPTLNPSLPSVISQFTIEQMPKFRRELLKFIDFNTQYADAGFTTFMNSQQQDLTAWYDSCRKIWANKPVTVVGCKNVFDTLRNNIFDNASSMHTLLVPNKHAYRVYSSVLSELLKENKQTLILLMCGPLGKVLAADLAGCGYRALDLGHLAKSYDYYKQNISYCAENIAKFHEPDE